MNGRLGAEQGALRFKLLPQLAGRLISECVIG
jgi:hypothetical protein